jgi:hypothetical protein
MQLRFAYPTLPRGYSQKVPLVDATPALTQTRPIPSSSGPPWVCLSMGGHLPKRRMSTRPCVLGASQRSGKERPCISARGLRNEDVLPVSHRGQDRLKAYQEKRIVYY